VFLGQSISAREDQSGEKPSIAASATALRPHYQAI